MKRHVSLLLLLPSFLAMAWLISQVRWFWNTQPDLQFGWVVLLLCFYLFWEAWEKRPAVDCRARWWGLFPMTLGAALLFVVQVYQAAFGTNAASTQGLALGVLAFSAGNVALVFGGAGLRIFGMPYAFILVALPLPSIVHGFLVNGLQYRVAAINTEVLNLCGVPAEQVGSLIHLPNGTVGIDEACSGIRSLQSTVMAALFIGYLSLRRTSLRLWLLGGGVLLAIVGNVIRSLYLSFTAYSKGFDSVGKVHDTAGWSILGFTALGVIGLSWLFSKLEKAADRLAQPAAASEPEETCAPPASTPPM